MNLPSLLLPLPPDCRGGGRPKLFLRVLGRGRAVFKRVGGLGRCRIDARTLHSHLAQTLVLWPLERWRQGTTRPEQPRDARRRAGSGVSLFLGGTSILQSINIMSARADGTDGPSGGKQSTQMQRPGSRPLRAGRSPDRRRPMLSHALRARPRTRAASWRPAELFHFQPCGVMRQAPGDGGAVSQPARLQHRAKHRCSRQGTGPS
jgi:hypothetical protein